MSLSETVLRTITVGGRSVRLVDLRALLPDESSLLRLPYSIRVLLENVARCGEPEEVAAVAGWTPAATPSREITFSPSRVLLQDFTGVPCMVDLAAMRDAMADLGGDPERINPLVPVELVIDHSVQVDYHGAAGSLERNVALEFERNRERYTFLKWGQKAFRNVRVVPPSTGIVHQVNLEYLARVVFVTSDTPVSELAEAPVAAVFAYPDTLVGTDSHTTMVNGLGVLGWGVGGIEAEAAMLGQPISMLLPQVIGVRLTGELPEGATATDLVLTITEMLRGYGVVGKFVEFFGPGAAALTVSDRATIANMSPEYGATCGFFPIDDQTLHYLRITGRDAEHIALVEACARAQGLFREPDREPEYTDVLNLDLSTVSACAAGPRRPQDRAPLAAVPRSFRDALPQLRRAGASDRPDRDRGKLTDGSVVIAAITSCTNTSNPSVLVAAGLLARNAAQRGLMPPAWVKASLAPGSRTVTAYLKDAGLLEPLEQLGFHVVGYGCTTCIGNSGPLPPDVSHAIEAESLVVASVLSGNRNFEGRVQQEVRANYLMSPPLVVAYALAGSIEVDLTSEPLGRDADGRPVMLSDIWPTSKEVEAVIAEHVTTALFRDAYAGVFDGDENWRNVNAPQSSRYTWDPASTYIKRPPFFDGMGLEPGQRVCDITGARALAVLGDSVTTDHISPAGSIRANSPAGQWLIARGVQPAQFNSYGSRRGHDDVMARGTFANVRIRNRLVPEVEGGYTLHIPTGETLSIFDAAQRYKEAGTPLIIIAGKEYGSGSSRDWAAKGPSLLGVRAVLAESFERIHRSNLIGMGIVPLQFEEGESAPELGLTGHEVFDVLDLDRAIAGTGKAGRRAVVRATARDGRVTEFEALVRIDTPKEAEYYRHGGILQYVLRQLLAV
jgi:aconitate hydratase